MEFEYFLPAAILKPYIKYYWVLPIDRDISNQILYPSGFLELAINISSGHVITHVGDRSIKMPRLEILGQLTMPTRVTATRGTTMLITRFYPYASSVFFPNQVSDFTNDSIDLSDILNRDSIDFYDRLMEQDSLGQKIKVLETFLIQRLIRNKKSDQKLKLAECLCNRVYNDGESFNIQNLSAQYGISERYLQRLFLDWVGLTPKKFYAIQRFNKSLEMVQSSDFSLTSIAYECGYFDQAHFIREFKSFTGVTPGQVMMLTKKIE